MMISQVRGYATRKVDEWSVRQATISSISLIDLISDHSAGLRGISLDDYSELSITLAHPWGVSSLLCYAVVVGYLKDQRLITFQSS